MVFLVTLQVILRFFNMPLFGIEELLTFPTIWVYFLGGACAAYTNSHIECGIVKAVSKNKHAVQITEIVCNIVASALAIYVFDWAVQYSIHSLEIGKNSKKNGKKEEIDHECNGCICNLYVLVIDPVIDRYSITILFCRSVDFPGSNL